MPRYIDADSAIKLINKDIKQCNEDLECDGEEEAYTRAVNARITGLNYCRQIINSQPTADVVEVVRCKDCKHCKSEKEYNNISMCFYRYNPVMISLNGYCSNGQRREKE